MWVWMIAVAVVLALVFWSSGGDSDGDLDDEEVDDWGDWV